MSLVGYKLRDAAGNSWTLDSLATINAGAEKSIKREGQGMAMNNSGDKIELLDTQGAVIDVITYGAVSEDTQILHP